MRLRIPSRNGAGPRILRIAFGVYSLYLFRQHLRHISIVASALLSLALTIDLILQIPALLNASKGLATDIADLLSLLLFRAGDLLPRYLPLSLFLGVLWTEVTLTSSRERLLVWNSARSPLQFLAPVTAIAVIFGVAQFGLDNFGRPAAMSAQMKSHLGSLGQMYDRRLTTRGTWFSAGSDLVRANVQYAPVVLHDVTLYRFDAAWRLIEIDTAETAVPDQNRNTWRLLNGRTWAFGSKPGVTPTAFSGRKVTMALDPILVSAWGIGFQYLSPSALAAFATVNHDTLTDLQLRTRMEWNLANAAMPGAMALLASVTALFVLLYRVQFIRVFAGGMVGYAAYLAMSLSILLGEHGVLSPAVAAWLVPISICLSAGVLLAIFAFRGKARIAAVDEVDLGVLKTAGREPSLATVP
jgi:lipopolysaccharide export LptBFGC system permease protein LptF